MKDGVKCAHKWFEDIPDEVMVSEGGKVEILWDRSVMTTKPLEHNRSDIVAVDRILKRWTIVVIAVP